MATIAQTARRESVWVSTADMPTFSALKENVCADVCIVGAGIAGLTTGYLLTRAGKSVVILDDGEVAGGMTQVTTAHLTNVIDDRYTTIERLHGERGARLAAESHGAAIDKIEEIARNENIACDFERVDGYLFLTPGESEELLDRELDAAQRAGLRDARRLSRPPVDCFDFGPCLHFPSQAQFHPLKYLAGMARAIQREGGFLFTNSHADRIDGGKTARVKVGRHDVIANAVVVATNTPINDLVAIHTKQFGHMTYVIGARVPHGSIPRALYWDTGAFSQEGHMASYHYLRLQGMPNQGEGTSEHDLLIVGGEDHKTGQASNTEDRHHRLETWAREHFPMIDEIEFTWGGQVMETVDGLAFIGRNPLDSENVFIITGDSGMGMTHGTIGGMLITDLIQGRDNPWRGLYDPSRKPLAAAGGYIKEALNTAAQYAGWLTGGDVSSTDEIPRNSGALLRRGLTKVAVYRDDTGKLHELSAVCPHLGCLVQWNSAERTWDCPCHGSRFAAEGSVISGPANKGLTPHEQ